jgi:Flp pilus assembly protein TadD
MVDTGGEHSNLPPAMWVRTALVCIVTLLPGCASAPARSDRAGIPVDELLAGRPLGLMQAPVTLVDAHEVLTLSPEMRAFLDQRVTDGAGSSAKLRQLVSAIMRKGDFRLEYDETTRTASETFLARRGNCLSFSNLFVALARQVGLNASFQEVDTPPDWSFRDDTFVLNRHVNVVVAMDRGIGAQERLGSLVRSGASEGEHVVDFNMDDFRTTYDRRRISDQRALAHYYNNVGVERMQAGDTASALAYFREAIDNDRSFSPAWTNLGILYMRNGHPAHAEAAQLQALNADPRDLVALSNLASLYELQGDRERAAAYRKRAADHRNRNPYYRFQHARAAFQAEDYDAAIRHLNGAIRQKKNEDQFYFLLGLSYLKKGDPRAARRWLSRAEEVAATDVLKRRYASKLDILLPPPQDEDRPR